jgi:hypothetical protein
MALEYDAGNNVRTFIKAAFLDGHIDFFILWLNHDLSVNNTDNIGNKTLRAAACPPGSAPTVAQ